MRRRVPFKERRCRPRRSGAMRIAFGLLSGCLVLAASAAAEATTMKQAVELAFASKTGNLAEDPLRLVPESAGTRDAPDKAAALRQSFYSGEGFATAPDRRLDADKRLDAGNGGAGAGRLKEAAEFVAFDAVEAYLAVLRGRDLVGLAEENLAALVAIVHRLESDADKDPGAVRQAELRVDQARALLTDQQNLLRDAEAEYARRIGQRPGELEAATPPIAALPRDLASAVAAARRNNLMTTILDSSLNKSDELTDISLFSSAKLNDDEGDGRATSSAVDSIESTAFDWAFLTAGTDSAGVEGPLTLTVAAQPRHLRSPSEAERAMRSAWNALEASRQSVIDLKSAVAFARETRAVYGRQFSAGERTLLDVQDAEKELFVAASELSTAETNEALAGYRILAVAGSLLATLGVTAPGAAQQADWKAGLLD